MQLEKSWYYLSKDFFALYLLIIIVSLLSLVGVLALLPRQLAQKNYAFVLVVFATFTICGLGSLWAHRKHQSLKGKFGRRIEAQHEKTMQIVEQTLRELNFTYTIEKIPSKWLHTGWFTRFNVNGQGLRTVIEITMDRFGFQQFEISLNNPKDIPPLNLICQKLNSAFGQKN